MAGEGGVNIDTYVRFADSFEPTAKSLRATVLLTEGKHDLVNVDTIHADVDRLPLAYSKPSTVQIRANGVDRVYNGYLDTSNAVRQTGPADNVLSILGITSVLRDGHARAWTRMLPKDIALEVLRPYKLGLEFDRYDIPFDFFSQSDKESDWQLLVRMAERIGFSLVSEGPVVRFVDPVQELRRTESYGYLTLALPAAGSQTGNVSQFRLATSTTPTGADYRNWKMVGTDKLRQRFAYEVSYARAAAEIDPEFDAVHTGTFTSLGQAMIEAQRVRRQARWTQRATASLLGYRDLRPGRYVFVADRQGPHGGFWYVTDVKHTFDNLKNVSQTQATVCRSSKMTSLNRLVAPPRTRPMLRLINDRWQSDRQWEVLT